MIRDMFEYSKKVKCIDVCRKSGKIMVRISIGGVIYGIIVSIKGVAK